MNDISASFNFPSDFFWGIVPPDLDDPEMDIQTLLFRLQEMSVRAILVKVPWSKCEPLKEHFDEVYIESLRQKLIRIRNRNMMPVIIPDTLTPPPWLNLDHPKREDRENRYGSGFIKHLAGAVVSFTNFIGIPCPTLGPLIHTAGDPLSSYFSELFGHIRSLAPDVKAGIILPEDFTDRQRGIAAGIFRMRMGFLKNSGMDFLGMPTAENATELIQSVLGTIRIPTIFISDGLAALSSEQQASALADKVFTAWQTYQKGLPVIGYLSEINLTSEDISTNIYTNICKSNAFQISTDMNWITEKWLRFLKD